MDKEKALKIWLPVIADGVKDLPECKESLEMATKALENQKTGYWIIDANDKDYCFCQFCKCRFDVDRLKMIWGTYEFPPHCPNCGAELKGDNNDTTN